MKDLPEDVVDLVEDAYYDGLIHNTLHTFLVDNEELIVVPIEFSDMPPQLIEDKLDNLRRLNEYNHYANEIKGEILYDEDTLKDFNKDVYEILKESYAEYYLEQHFQNQLENHFKYD